MKILLLISLQDIIGSTFHSIFEMHHCQSINPARNTGARASNEETSEELKETPEDACSNAVVSDTEAPTSVKAPIKSRRLIYGKWSKEPVKAAAGSSLSVAGMATCKSPVAATPIGTLGEASRTVNQLNILHEKSMGGISYFIRKHHRQAPASARADPIRGDIATEIAAVRVRNAE
ncbi:hypothetical protein QQS21_001302 [Conoideocrella luteorostrata]|uniref:Uncharacterized protein n=1 Tax=Conoideocrella luteorostrata TaxID=1105319 RepID=A0AAJ0CXD7_9HYPO|nr:hypothetical protein QQS21_001302 [Conoideocrella luteorostrata]